MEKTPNDIDELFKIIAQECMVTELERHRSPHVYRGVSDLNYQLETNLQRMGGVYWDLEYHLLRNFRKYSSIEDNLSEATLWKLMAIAQHHGLPTRLLDWTFSPFVALHFVAYEPRHYKKDGAIFCIDYTKIHKDLPNWANYELINSQAKMFSAHMLEGMVKHSLDEILEKEPNNEKYKHRRSIQTQLRAFDRLQAKREDDDKNFLIFFEPPSLDARIVNQYALFSISSSAKCDIGAYLNKFHSDALCKIIIPKELKWKIRNRLDQYNITERILIPGYDGLASYLKRHYGPAPKYP
jgi:hypothetical protein